MKKEAGMALFFVFLFALTPSFCFAKQTIIPGDSFEKNSLQARVVESDVNVDFNESVSTMDLRIEVENKANKNMQLSFAVLKEGEWLVLRDLGELAPRKTGSYALSQEFEWDAEVKNYEYAIIGDDGKTRYGYEFSMQKKWDEFIEKNFKDTLVQGYLILVPIITFVLICILFIAVEIAFKRQHWGEIARGEYTLKTLFFPILKGRPFNEKIADVILNPFFWIAEVICCALFLSLVFSYTLTSGGYELGQYVFIIGGAVALLTPILYVFAVWMADYLEREPLRFIGAAFFWGFLAAFTAFIVNTLLSGTTQALLGGVSSEEFSVIVLSTALIAPVVEEILKGIGVAILGGHHEMNDATDGIVYGFTIGAGFAFIENWFYFAAEAHPINIGLKAWIALLLYRSFFNTIAHGCFTAAVGAVIGYMKTNANLRKYAQIGAIPGIMIAILLHVSFNVGAILDTIAIYQWNFAIFVFNPLFVATLGTTFVIIFALSIMQTKKRMQQEFVVEDIIAKIRE
ncbi:PrsW family intramembrane metalloprotease [Candidatus Micrarchaeota archaeon]|nr:PrsW family intramembrane metalloprotease [Candidatus Micrarchaeota archaeon]